MLIFPTVIFAETNTIALKKLLTVEQNIIGKFQQKVYFEQELQEQTTGNFIISKPNGLLWKVADPYNQLTISNGIDHWFYDQDLDELQQVDDANLEDNIFIQILMGNFQHLDNFAIAKQNNTYILTADNYSIKQIKLTFADNKITTAELSISEIEKVIYAFTEILLNNDKIDNKIFDINFYKK